MPRFAAMPNEPRTWRQAKMAGSSVLFNGSRRAGQADRGFSIPRYLRSAFVEVLGVDDGAVRGVALERVRTQGKATRGRWSRRRGA